MKPSVTYFSQADGKQWLPILRVPKRKKGVCGPCNKGHKMGTTSDSRSIKTISSEQNVVDPVRNFFLRGSNGVEFAIKVGGSVYRLD